MGIEDVPVKSPMVDENNMITQPWREWLENFKVAFNTTTTLEVVTDIGPPQVKTEITFVDGS